MQALQRVGQAIFRVHPHLEEIGDIRLARLVMVVALVVAIFTVIGCMGALKQHPFNQDNAVLLVLSACGLLAYGLGRTHWFYAGAIVLVSSFTAFAFVLILIGSQNPSRTLNAAIPIAMVMASVLLRRAGLAALTVSVTSATVLLPLWVDTITRRDALQVAGSYFTLGCLLMIANAFRNNLERTRLQELREANRALLDMRVHLEERVEERTQHAEVARQEAEMARQEAEASRRVIEEQAWLAAGQLQLGEALQGEQSIQALADQALGAICRYLEIQAATFYQVQGDTLHPVGGYATCRAAPSGRGEEQAALPVFQFGEGLVGQAALEQRRIVLDQIPADCARLRTGMGEMPPRQVLIQPIRYGERLVGVMELAMLLPLTPLQLRFLGLVENNLAMVMQSAVARQDANGCPESSQRMTRGVQ